MFDEREFERNRKTRRKVEFALLGDGGSDDNKESQTGSSCRSRAQKQTCRANLETKAAIANKIGSVCRRSVDSFDFIAMCSLFTASDGGDDDDVG